MMSRMMLLTTLMLASLTLSTATLTKDNLSEVAGDKMVFLLLYAPWCGHCRAVKPAWEALTEDFRDSDTLFVSEVDCTSNEGKELCAHLGVQGYPTIKYWTDGAGKEDAKPYQGGRDLDALRKHVEDNMLPKCDAKDPEGSGCDDQEIAYVAKMITKGGEALEDVDALRKPRLLVRLHGGPLHAFEAREFLLDRLAALLGRVRDLVPAGDLAHHLGEACMMMMIIIIIICMVCLLYTSPSPRDQRGWRMPS